MVRKYSRLKSDRQRMMRSASAYIRAARADRFVGSANDGNAMAAPPPATIGGGEFTDGGEGTLADSVEKRSGVVDRVRPLPMRRSCRPWQSAARVRCRDPAQGSSETIFRYSSADHARAVRVRTLPNELSASANLATLSPFGVSTKTTRSLSPLV